ncbi:MAG TPA: DinB family protein [Candidatus Dormibacteraeota bacterium]|nr:DinB family protein [Candidatus Dormibacteraeota bacterium]
MQANRLISSQLNAVNHQLHELAAWMQPEDWLRRSVPGTSLPAFTFWHIPRVIDTTVNMGIRGVPELIESQPWAAKRWARPEGGVGYTVEEADELAAEVVPAEVLDYADAIRSQVSQWLKTITDEELAEPSALMEHTRGAPAYGRPEVHEAIAPLAGQPVWLVLSITCYAHCWAHIEEIKLLASVGRAANAPG